MKPLTGIVRVFKGTLMLLASIVLSNCFICNVYAQYSDDLKDIFVPRNINVHDHVMFHEPTPIGNIGKIQTVVDLRGFMPMVLLARPSHPLLNAVGLGESPVRWFKIPTQKALLLLYSGSLHLGDVSNDTTNLETGAFTTTRFMKESDAKGESALWCKLAYEAAKNSDSIFERIAGSGFKSAEPTTIIFTEQTVFVILSLKYDGLLRSLNAGIQDSTVDGQVLIALEFSRFTKNYKTLYNLFSTTVFNKTSAQEFKETASIIGQIVSAIWF